MSHTPRNTTENAYSNEHGNVINKTPTEEANRTRIVFQDNNKKRKNKRYFFPKKKKKTQRFIKTK